MSSYTFRDLYRDLMDIVFLNFIFLVVVLVGAFITFGAAFKALIFVSFKIIDRTKQNYVFKSFFMSFKEDFLKSTIIWLVIGVLGYLLYSIWNFAILNEQIIIIISCLVSFYILINFLIYIFGIMAMFQTKSSKQLLKNSIIIANTNFSTSLKLFASLIFVIGLFYFFTGTILFSIGLFGILIAFHLKPVFIPYLKHFEISEDENVEKSTIG